MDSGKAKFVIKSTFAKRDPTGPEIVINNSNGGSASPGFPVSHRSFGRTDASISVVELESSRVAFAYSVGKSANTNQLQSAAEACAKHLREFIEKQEKGR
jgi:hypothetical protein